MLAGLALLAILALPLVLWLGGGSAAFLLAVPPLILLLLMGLVQLGLRGGSGGIGDLIAGQRDPGVGPLLPEASLRGVEGTPSYAVELTLDLVRPLARVSERFVSFSFDLSQVVGGKWWDPRAEDVEWGSGAVNAPVFDFNRPRLDLLASTLAPAYLRIGGSESDKVYYAMQVEDKTKPMPPQGYESVLSGAEWDGVNEFALRNGLRMAFTLSAGPSVRGVGGDWDGGMAAELLAYTSEREYPVEVYELGNEVNLFFALYGLRAQIPAAQYAADLQQARELLERHAPGAALASQGSAFMPVLGEPLGSFFGMMPDYLRLAGDLVDLVTWHYYPQQSRRGPVASRRAHPARLLIPRNLDEADHWAGKMVEWRDRYAPGKTLWLGETGNAQNGGEPGVSDIYIGGLWWLDQLGLMARRGHEVVVRQTLCGSNYGMLDDELVPRPDYWNSLLWRRLMGTRVYGVRRVGERADRLRVYAHSAPLDGGVTVLAINLDPRRDALLTFPQFASAPCRIYRVNAPDVLGTRILLNDKPLELGAGDQLPELQGERHKPLGRDALRIHPLSYAFFVFPSA
jgi:heparanase 1